MTEKDLMRRDSIVRRDPISPGTYTGRNAHVLGSTNGEGNAHVHRNTANIKTVRRHGRTWIGARIRQKNNGPVMRPWML